MGVIFTSRVGLAAGPSSNKGKDKRQNKAKAKSSGKDETFVPITDEKCAAFKAAMAKWKRERPGNPNEWLSRIGCTRLDFWRRNIRGECLRCGSGQHAIQACTQSAEQAQRPIVG